MDADKLAKRRAQNRAHYEANKEKYKARSKAWREANPERYKELTAKHNAANREKMIARSAAWYQENRAKASKNSRKNKLKGYGLTPEQFTAILRYQEGQCPICERFLGITTTPSVDHSHATGSVRGILCRKCNAALGMLEDNPGNVERALEYLSMSRLVSFTRWLSGVISTTNK